MIFAPTIPHDSGVQLQLDDTLLLLCFREPTSRADVQHLLEQTSVRLEEPIVGIDVGGSEVKRRVNNTVQLYWVRSQSGDSILNNHVMTLQQDLATVLAWIGPVLRLPPTKSNPNGHPVCAMPHALGIKPKPGADPGALDHSLNTLQLRFEEHLSKYLNGLRLYYLEPSSVQPVLPPTAAYDLQIELRSEQYKDFVAQTFLNFMPMFVPTGGPLDPMYSQQWNLPRIKAVEGWSHAGWDTSTSPYDTQPFPAGAGVRVAVIDDGCDLDHEDLSSAFDKTNGATFYPQNPPRTPNPQIGPIGAGTNSLDGGREQGGTHGTWCAGVLAARCNNKDASNNPVGITGLAGACQIVPIRLEAHSEFELIAAINYAAGNTVGNPPEIIPSKCAVISFSNNHSMYNTCNVQAAVRAAYSAYSIICAAAGNDDSPAVDYPAAFSQDTMACVMACGATSDANIEDRCTGSIWNSNTGKGSNYGDALSVTAPGVNILTCANGSTYKPGFEGTSAATPQVAALAALIIGRYPLLRGFPQAVRAIIEYSADKVGTVTVINGSRYPGTVLGDPLPYQPSVADPTKTWNWETGCGRINVYGAMQKASQFKKPHIPVDLWWENTQVPIWVNRLISSIRDAIRRPPAVPPLPHDEIK